jgi:two-component system, response regulator
MKNSKDDILLIDDCDCDMEMTMREFKKYKISNSIKCLDGGEQALDYLLGKGAFTGINAASIPKLILLDMKMPKVDGMEVLAAIKKNESTRDIPVVMLTSEYRSPDIDKCVLMGANNYLVKPIRFSSFIKVVAHSGLFWMLDNRSDN